MLCWLLYIVFLEHNFYQKITTVDCKYHDKAASATHAMLLPCWRRHQSKNEYENTYSTNFYPL